MMHSSLHRYHMTYLSFTFWMCSTLVRKGQVRFHRGPYKSGLDAMLSEKLSCAFSCSDTLLLVQPQKIPHHLPQSSCAKPARPFRELQRGCLPSSSPMTFLVYSGLPRGRTWAQWRRKPSPWMLPSSIAQAGSGPHCHSTGWLLLSEISILFVSSVRLISLIMFIFSYSFPSTFLISGRPLSILKIWLQSWLWNGLNASHRFFPCRDTLGGCACLTATTRSMPTEFLSLINCGNKVKFLVPHSCTPWPLKASKCNMTLPFDRYRSTPHTPPRQKHIWDSPELSQPAPGVSGKALTQSSWKLLWDRNCYLKIKCRSRLYNFRALQYLFFCSRNKKTQLNEQKRAWLKKVRTLSLGHRYSFPKLGTLRGLSKQAIHPETHEQADRWPHGCKKQQQHLGSAS